ncbi:MAG TPA: efflux RND transporter permease subunit [Gemmatimonadales bacterium]|jgi:HAE1 family hydrophobic/amphiphilic exporter-1
MSDRDDRHGTAAPAGDQGGGRVKSRTKSLSSPWISRPVMTTLIMGGILIFGIASYRGLPVADLPSVDYPTISVTASLPGASPETMASAVATPLEKQFSTIAGLASMTSSSLLGTTSITLQFDLNRNIDAAAADVQAAMTQASRTLPTTLLPPSYRKVDPSASSIILYSLTSSTLPLSTVDEYGENEIAQQLSTVSGVAQVQVYGSQKYAVRIQLDPQALAARKIGIDQVFDAVNNGNVDLPTGTLWGSDKAYSLDAQGQLLNAAAYRPLIVAWRDGRPVRLGDLGNVVDSVQDTKAAAWFNNSRGVVLGIQRQPGTNTIAVAQAVRDEMAQMTRSLPASVKVTTIYDRSESIDASVKDVKFTLYLTLFLVVLVIFLFLRNVSATIIPSLALPMSLVGTFAVMYLLGYSLDNLSLMALTLSVGFVVDDAIVMLENIVRHTEMGENPRDAAYTGSAEIGFTILSMTMSLVAVFIPVLFLGGLIGRLFHEFAVTIGAAILVSGFVSLTLTPMLCSRFLRVGHADEGRGALAPLFRITEGIYERALHGYDRGLRLVLDHPRPIYALSAVILLATIWLARAVPKGFIPSEDQGQLRVTTETSEGTSFDGMYRHQVEANQMVLSDSNVAGFMSSLGTGGGGNTTNQGRFIVRLAPRDQRKETADDVARELQAKLSQIPGLRAFVQNPPVINIGGRLSKSLYQYTLQGSDIPALYKASQELQARMEQMKDLRGVTSDLQIKNPEIQLSVDRDRASAVGVTMQQVENALYDAYGARQVSTIYTSTNQYWVVMELLPQYQRDLGAMSLISVQGGNGQLVPFTALAKVSEAVGPLTVNHSSQLPAVTISFDLGPGVSIGPALEEVQRVSAQILPTGITAQPAGTAQAFQDAQHGLAILLVLAIVVIYIVLGVLYESFIHPLTIFSGLPFAGFGALLALMVFHMELSVYAFVGIIMLIGLVKKNAIMMIDFAVEAERKEGKSARAAIHEACMVRFRPIMMTTMAALMGTLPIALGSGAGAESRRPLGVAVVGGLAVSQLITLFVTPVVYVFFDGLKQRMAHRRSHRAHPVVVEPAP